MIEITKPMPTAQIILDILAQVTEVDEVRHNPDLAVYQTDILDSLKTVELIVAFGREFDLDISPAELDRESWATPARIVQYVQARVGR